MKDLKRAILLVSFGTSHPDTLAKTISAIETTVGEAFRERTLRRAFTSPTIMKKLAKAGTPVDDIPTALRKLAKEGYDDIVLQPTHILNGEDYETLMVQAEPFVDEFDQFAFGDPLLTTVEDFQEVAEVLVGSVPPKTEGTAIVFIGHGTEHFSNAAYAQMHYLFHDMGRSDIAVGTVEGYPEVPQVLRRLEERGDVKKVILYPMMIVAGDHAKNDLAGDVEDSWKSKLEAKGYEVSCVLRGMGELQGIQEIFVRHAGEANYCV